MRALNSLMRAILVTAVTFWASLDLANAASFGQGSVKIFDVIRVHCELSGADYEFQRIFPASAIVQIKSDVIAAFAKTDSDRDHVILRYSQPLPPLTKALPVETADEATGEQSEERTNDSTFDDDVASPKKQFASPCAAGDALLIEMKKNLSLENQIVQNPE